MYTEALAGVVIDSVIGNTLRPSPRGRLGAVANAAAAGCQWDEQLMCNPFIALDAMTSSECQQHRVKRDDSSCYNLLGLVTRIIPSNSAEFKSPVCQKALDKEVSRLRDATVWDEDTVAEWSDVRNTRKDGKPPMVGIVFPIMGQKSAEVLDEEITMKTRAVFQGNFIQTGDGSPAHEIFQEVGATPCNMVNARTSAACAALKGHRASLRDAEQAYIQSYIDAPGRGQTYVRLPKAWWPAHWCNKDGSCKYDDPVCLLVKSLCGHPESGPLWDKKMRRIMKKHGYLELESSPGVFYNPVTDVEVNVYVDDFVMFSPEELEAKLWDELDEDIKFKDPAMSLERYLGVYFEAYFEKDGTAVLKTQMTNSNGFASPDDAPKHGFRLHVRLFAV